MNDVDNISSSSLDTSSFLVDAPEVRDAAANVADFSSEARPIRRNLLRAVTDHHDKKAMLLAVSQVVSRHTSSEATFYFERDQFNTLLPGQLLEDKGTTVSDFVEDDLRTCAEAVCAEGHLTVYPLDRDATLLAIPVPVYLPHSEPEVYMAIVSQTSQSQELLGGLLEIVAVHIALWHAQQDAVTDKTEAQSTAALQDLLTQLEGCDDLHKACGTLVNELQEYLGCQRMALALRSQHGGQSRLQAVSGSAKFDRHSPFVSAVESALDEAVLRDTLTVWPPVAPGDRHAALAHHKLCSVAGVQCVVSSPLRGPDGKAIGAWLFLGTRQSFEQPNVLDFIRASEPRVAACLSLLQRAGGGPFAKLRKSLCGGKFSWKAKLSLVIVCVLLAALFFPVHYKIRCDCRLEPVSRRFVAAPYDGILEKALVMPGATVSEGDVLARMDGREIRWDLAGITAERDRAIKQRDAAFANRRFAAAEVAKLDVDRFELKIKLQEQRQRNLEIKSPIDGIVTVGDLDRAQGAPVSCGETLFEIAPLAEMTVELAVPQSDIAYVHRGQQVYVHLEACPSAPYHATITRILPRSEIREQQNVFVAEVSLENTDGNLRPGMQGRAAIVGPRRTVAWTLFHKPWESLCLMLGW